MEDDGLPREMTELELATTLPLMKMDGIKFKSKEAQVIVMQRVTNEMERLYNEILDDKIKIDHHKKRLLEELHEKFGGSKNEMA